MDDDEIHATMAFLAEFEGAASDEEPSLPRHAGRVSATAKPVATAAGVPSRQRKTTPKPNTKAKASRSTRKTTTSSTTTTSSDETVAETEIVARTTSAASSETVPLAAQPKSRKEELEFMREQVKELEEKLRLLKRTTRSDADEQQTDEQLSGGLALVSLEKTRQPQRIASMWEDLAMRQYQQRQRAEVENLKLKSSLEDQLKVAKSLQRMLKRSKCDVLTPQNHAKRSRRLDNKSMADEAAEFEELSSTVTDMYSDIDAAFADARFATADVDFRDVNVRQDAVTGTIIEVLNAKMVPFDFRTTAKAMWDYFIHDSLEAQGFTVERTFQLANDAVMKTIRVELQVKRYHGLFRGKIVGRRYCEADRVVIVWAVLAEPVEVSDAPMDGILMRQRGWTIVRKSELDDNVAMIQTKHVAIPTLYDDDVPDHKRKLELLTNYVVYMLFHQIDAGQQVVENLLFESLRTAATATALAADSDTMGYTHR